MISVSDEEIQRAWEKLNREAKQGGYNLNPDLEFSKSLIKGLLINESRYGYWACPCRLASGKKNEDLDIICPCDYRDADLNRYDACYCCLYVSDKIVRGEKKATSIPERRPPPDKSPMRSIGREHPESIQERAEDIKQELQPMNTITSHIPLPIWRCKVCGYLCAREEPPETCPICKVKKERFEVFIPAK